MHTIVHLCYTCDRRQPRISIISIPSSAPHPPSSSLRSHMPFAAQSLIQQLGESVSRDGCRYPVARYSVPATYTSTPLVALLLSLSTRSRPSPGFVLITPIGPSALHRSWANPTHPSGHHNTLPPIHSNIKATLVHEPAIRVPSTALPQSSLTLSLTLVLASVIDAALRAFATFRVHVRIRLWTSSRVIGIPRPRGPIFRSSRDGTHEIPSSSLPRL